jgi:hypothetical protein
MIRSTFADAPTLGSAYFKEKDRKSRRLCRIAAPKPGQPKCRKKGAKCNVVCDLPCCGDSRCTTLKKVNAKKRTNVGTCQKCLKQGKKCQTNADCCGQKLNCINQKCRPCQVKHDTCVVSSDCCGYAGGKSCFEGSCEHFNKFCRDLYVSCADSKLSCCNGMKCHPNDYCCKYQGARCQTDEDCCDERCAKGVCKCKGNNCSNEDPQPSETPLSSQSNTPSVKTSSETPSSVLQ